METDIKKLKKDVKRLLSKKSLRLWKAVVWNKDEVGNSIIGFYDIDPEIKAEKIAKFLNIKAEEKI